MKKGFCFFLTLLCYLHSYSQQVYSIERDRVGVYNNVTDKIDFTSWQKRSRLNLIIQGKTILINDSFGSVYTTGTQIEKIEDDEKLSVTWKATNEKGVPCRVQALFRRKEAKLSYYIIYETTVWEYEMVNALPRDL